MDQLTMFDADLLFNYWKDSPPLHVTVNAYFGLGARHPKPTAMDMDFCRALEGQGVKTYDNLPLDVQQWLADEVLPKMNREVN